MLLCEKVTFMIVGMRSRCARFLHTVPSFAHDTQNGVVKLGVARAQLVSYFNHVLSLF